jgi:hypothetical protein
MRNDQRRSRPKRVTILALLAFCFALWNCLRLGEAIYFWKTLLEYGTYPFYFAASGGVWSIAGFFLTWGLWEGRRWVWLATTLVTLCYAAWYWLDRLLLQRPHSNWPFALIATIVLLIVILFILLSRKTRQFFQRDPHVRKFKNSTPA